MMRILKTLFFLILPVFIGNVFSQECFDEIADQEIHFESFNFANDAPHTEEFLKNLYCFVGEDLDSIDIEILSDGPILGSIFIKSINDQSGTLTYRSLRELMINATKETRYSKMKDLHLLTRDFSKLPAIYENWDVDKQALLKLGIPEQKLEPFVNYLKTHSDSTKTYEELMNEFEVSKATNSKTTDGEAENSSAHYQLDDLLENKGALNLDSLVELSKSEGKPILLYFTGYNAVNGRRFEQVVLKNQSILKSLYDDFIFLAIYVDDRRELLEEEQRYSETLRQTVKTVGDFNLLQQIERYNTATQPYLVGLTSKKEVIGTGTYEGIKSAEHFLTFLNGVKVDFEK